ncbi:response regulator [Desulfobaculum bizertense]|uniref:sensor histidine kinase n=1 Tax=Desulfobaculum bizertense TaxID=376490 RepID=UPI001F417A03|nr:histidine kinase dimerization/phosphoacceptor domain -containing protein [Desulfobaculum bizertense]UIJ37976.1 response regulator [Desulfobaculum bizertense]
MNEFEASHIADEQHSAQDSPLGKTLLVIDDEELIRQSIKGYLEDSGYVVLEAADGRNGLEMFRLHAPDLVLVDLKLPEIAGLDVLAQILAESPLTPVLVISGTGVLYDAIEALRLGAWDYITKPIQDMGVLEEALLLAFRRSEKIQRRVRYREELEREVERRTHELLLANEELNKNIEDRLKIEKKLSASLEEKEVLLKEIHHRVKNNLQIISSLLYLQSQHIPDPLAKEVFTESRCRVKSMALVHEKLYQSTDIAKIDYNEYLQQFVDFLKTTYLPPTHDIELKLNVNDVYLPVDSAIPVSLIINELVTNAFKYAWPQAVTGTLTLDLVSNGSRVELGVADNGVGLPENFDIQQAESLGMQLISSLVQQLGGEIRIDSEPHKGTHVIIRFNF